MAIDLGSSNSGRYHTVPDHADFTLPDDDWTWAALVQRNGASAVANYILSTGDWGSANTFNLYVYGDGIGGVGVKVSTFTEAFLSSASDALTLGSWYWVYATRRSGLLRAGQIAIGGSSATETGGFSISGSQNSGTGLYVGYRALGLIRPWNGRWSQAAFISGTGLTAAQMVEVANGGQLFSIAGPNIKFLAHGRTASDASFADLISGHVLTRQGGSYGTNEEDFDTPYIWTPSYVRGISTVAPVTGTSATTNADDTSAASGTTTVVGSSATTNANDTSAASGTTTVTGSSATTNADDVSAASGEAGDVVSGSAACTNSDDISSATGTTTVIGSAAVTNSNDVSSGAGTTTIVGTSATTNADDVSAASGETEAVAIVGTVAYTNIDDVSAASGTTTIIGSAAITNANDVSSAFGIVNNGISVETSLSVGTVSTASIKKPGVPSTTDPRLKTMLEIMLGRRGNKIAIPKRQTLTFSSTPTKAECEALYAYANEMQDALNKIITRFDS